VDNSGYVMENFTIVLYIAIDVRISANTSIHTAEH